MKLNETISEKEKDIQKLNDELKLKISEVKSKENEINAA